MEHCELHDQLDATAADPQHPVEADADAPTVTTTAEAPSEAVAAAETADAATSLEKLLQETDELINSAGGGDDVAEDSEAADAGGAQEAEIKGDPVDAGSNAGDASDAMDTVEAPAAQRPQDTPAEADTAGTSSPPRPVPSPPLTPPPPSSGARASVQAAAAASARGGGGGGGSGGGSGGGGTVAAEGKTAPQRTRKPAALAARGAAGGGVGGPGGPARAMAKLMGKARWVNVMRSVLCCLCSVG